MPSYHGSMLYLQDCPRHAQN